MLEKDIENLIAKYPDEFFPSAGFKLIGQQIRLGKCYADIIFEDKFHYNTNGFILNRDIVRNAIPHVNKNFVLNLDIKDFFPSINFFAVYVSRFVR